ncbi:MAG: hypothetical protein AAGA99_08945 [Actinomycetota bacterium]
MTFALPAAFSSIEQLVDTDTNLTITSGTADTKGAWFEIDASAAFDVQAVMIWMNRAGSKGVTGLLDVGVGPASSEVVEVADIVCGANFSRPGGYLLPVDIASGSRISVRLQTNNAADTILIEGFTILGGDTTNTTRPAPVAYRTPSGLNPSGGTDVFGSWVEVEDSLPVDVEAIQFMVSNGGDTTFTTTTIEYELGTGAAAAETRFSYGLVRTNAGQDEFIGTAPQLWWVGVGSDLPSGTRIAARRTASTGNGFNVGLLGLEEQADSAVDIVVADLATTPTLEALALTQQHEIVVSDLGTSSELDALALTQDHQVAVADLATAVELESLALTQAHALAVESLATSALLDGIDLSQAHVLAIADLTTAAALDGLNLTQAHELSIADLAVAASLEGVVLGVGGLEVAAEDLTTATQLESLALSQTHEIAVDSLSTAPTLDDVALTQAHQIEVGDLLTAAGIDGITISVGGVGIAVEELLTSTTLEQLVLTQDHTIVVDDLSTAAALEQVVLNVGAVDLSVEDLATATSLDDLELSQAHQITVADLLTAVTFDAVNLTQAHELVVGDLTTPAYLGTALVTVGTLATPAGRVLVVAAERRVLVVPAEPRVLVVPAP